MSALPLADIRVLDIATLIAGPLAATILGDYGADVIKVERPKVGDSLRTHGLMKDGVGLSWKAVARNKRTITLDFHDPEGQEIFKQLVRNADVVVENFRPGTLERWGLGYGALSAVNPQLILARVTGFGQTGPMSSQPGFGTLAECMSGFAHITGEADGPPTLPPFGLADGIAALATAFAIMTAIHARPALGRGQVIDTAIIEPILMILGTQITSYDQLGYIQNRGGNRSRSSAPRNTYVAKDGKWVAISTSATSIAERVMRLVGREDVISQPWFKSGGERAKHGDELDGAVADWIAERDSGEVVAAFNKVEAAIARVYDISDIATDPQYQALGTFVTLDDSELGHVKMQNVFSRLSATPGAVRFPGPRLGEHNAEVYGALGLDASKQKDLEKRGVI